MNFRKITDLNEAEQIYQDYIAADFPPAERQPLTIFIRMLRDSATDMYLWETEGQPAAYVVVRERDGYVLLQYFAVLKRLRGKGTGTGLLRQLNTLYGDKKGILLEVEHTGYAGNQEDLMVRRKRIAFYERCGYICLEDFDLALFGVHYQVMVLPIGENRISDHEYIFGIFQKMYCFDPMRNAAKVIQWVR